MTLYTVESPEVQHAYITITEFFDAYSLAAARRYLKKIVKAAGSFH